MILLDDLSDRELCDLQMRLMQVFKQTPHHQMRMAAAVLNELTMRTQRRGLFVEATGAWTEKGVACLTQIKRQLKG